MKKFTDSQTLLALSGLFALNLFDALATLLAINIGGVEVNPAMAWFLERGWWAFLAIKTFLGLSACLVMWHGRQNTWVPKASIACLGLYSAVAQYHVVLFLTISVTAMLI